MGNESNRYHGEFHFGRDGLFFDATGEPCVLIGTVEFQNFCHALDESYDAPLGRRLIYAATDAEERTIVGNDSFSFGRWFGRRRVEQALSQRAKSMGWGWFEEKQILSPAHDGLTVGFLLAHQEHLSKSRYDLEWKQHSSELIRVVFNPKQGDMVPAPGARRLNWSTSSSPWAPTDSMELDLDIREGAFYCGEARSFFLPINVLHHLTSGLCGRPVRPTPSLTISHLDGDLDEPDVFRSMVHAAMVAYKETDHPIFLQTIDDWNGHLSTMFTRRGFGTVKVQNSLLNGDDVTRFLIQSPAPAMVAGALIGMWQRAHGARLIASFRLHETGLLVDVAEPVVDY